MKKLLFEGSKEYSKSSSFDWVILGCPLDLTETYRPGTGEGPQAIRFASQSIESYSPFVDVDIAEHSIGDAGDLDFKGLSMEESLNVIEKRILDLSNGKPFVLGGEHTVSLAVLRALKQKYGDIMLVVADAHTDFREEYEGLKVNHATWLKRAAEFIPLENIILIGARAGTREEFNQNFLEIREDIDLYDETIQKLIDADAVYFSIDIDALDSCYVPGCGNPEPGGLHYKELEEFSHWLATSTNLIGADLVEVAPTYDSSGITAITAARIIREIIASSISARPL